MQALCAKRSLQAKKVTQLTEKTGFGKPYHHVVFQESTQNDTSICPSVTEVTVDGGNPANQLR